MAYKSGALHPLLLGMAVVFIVAVILPTFTLRPGRTDLHILHLAAQNLESGKPVYDINDANEHTKPPLATLLVVPFSHININELSRYYDVINVVVYVVLAFVFTGWFRNVKSARWNLLLVATLFLLNPWNKELRMGQYNLLTLAMLCSCLVHTGRGWQGGLAAIAVLLKPSNLIFLPWTLRESRHRIAWGAGFIGAIFSLALIYGLRYGWSSLGADHLTWYHFMPLSQAKQIFRFDNYSLTSLLARHSIAFLSPVLLGGYFVLILVCLKKIASPAVNLSIACVGAILFSPMAWLQNYVLLLPLVMLLWEHMKGVQGRGRWFVMGALASLYIGLEIFNPSFCGITQSSLCYSAVPLYSLLFALALVVVERRIDVFR